MTDNLPEETNAEEQNADELEKELLDAMRDLGSKNRKIEEYLDSLARTSEKAPEKPGPGRTDTPGD